MTLWLYIWTHFIKNSVVYKALRGLYSFISNSWKNSVITNWFRKSFFAENAAKNSILGKILFSPFTFLEYLRKNYNEKLNAQKERSFIIRGCKYFLHNLLAVNLRFIGVFVFTASVVDLILSVFRGGGFILNIIALVIGAALYFADVNAVDWVKGSVISHFIEECLGTEFSFNFYYVTKCSKGTRLLCAVFFGILTGVVSGFTSPLYAAVFAVGLWFVFMVFYKVEFGVFATVFLTPLIPTMAVVGLSFLCLVSLIVRALTSKKFEWRKDGVGLLILSMLAIDLIASVLSFAAGKSLQIWAVYFAFMIFYFVIINTVKTRAQFFNLLTVFALSGLLVCLYGVAQYVFGWNVKQAWIDEEMFEDIKMRIYSTLENPNVLGEYILLVLPVCISLAWTKKNILSKIIYAAMAVVCGAALILTFSRGCWIGVMFSAAIFITFAAGKLWGLALIALPVIPMILPQSIINRFLSIGDMKDSSTSYRVYIWMGTLLMLKDFWLSGIGLGTEAFTQVYPFYSYSSIVAPHSHNMFLQIWVESGIIGLAAFFLLMFFFVKKLISGYQKEGKYGEMSVTLTAIGAAVIGFLVQGMFDNCFYNYRVFMVFWTVIALGVAGVYIARGNTQKEVTAID